MKHYITKELRKISHQCNLILKKLVLLLPSLQFCYFIRTHTAEDKQQYQTKDYCKIASTKY